MVFKEAKVIKGRKNSKEQMKESKQTHVTYGARYELDQKKGTEKL